MLDPIWLTLIAIIIGLIIVFVKFKKYPKKKSSVKRVKKEQAKEKYFELKNEKKEKNNFESNLLLGDHDTKNNGAKNIINPEYKRVKIDSQIKNIDDKLTTENKFQKIEKEMEKMKEDNTKKFKDHEEIFKLNDLDKIIDRKRLNILEKKNDVLLSSYKILYLRKIANIFLDTILNGHSKKLYKTEKIFQDKTKPDYKKWSFPIIIAKEDINSIEINTINLLIDYLMFAKDFSSSVIHIVEKSKAQIEILFDLFGKEKIKINNEVYTISISLLINSFFSKNIKVDIKNDNPDDSATTEEKKKEENADIVNSEGNKIINQNINIINDNQEKHGSILSSENGQTTDEKSKSLKMFFNNNNLKSSNETNICTISEEDNEKAKTLKNNILFNKIDNIIENLKEYYLNNNKNVLINDVIAQIKSLDLDNLLKQDNKFSKNELLKLEKIKELNQLILNNNNLDENAIIDAEFIFQKWQKTFHKNYKATEEFQDLVLYDENVTFSDLENAVKLLISEQEINIFCEDPGDFKNYKIDTIAQSQFKNYNLDFKTKKKASK